MKSEFLVIHFVRLDETSIKIFKSFPNQVFMVISLSRSQMILMYAVIIASELQGAVIVIVVDFFWNLYIRTALAKVVTHQHYL